MSARLTPITRKARALYRAAFNGEDLPKGWKVYFATTLSRSGPEGMGRSSYLGFCWYGARVIQVKRPRLHPGWCRTLIHEFIHQRTRGRLRHGAEFERLVNAAYARLWS